MTPEEERLLGALAGMCAQYLEEDSVLDHKFMGAEEEALCLLTAYGLIEMPGRGGTWTDIGREFLANH